MSLEDPVPLLRQLSRHPVSPGRFGIILSHLSDWMSMRGIPSRVTDSVLRAEIGRPGGSSVLFATRVDTAGGRAATAAAACALVELAISSLAGRIVVTFSAGGEGEAQDADCAIVGSPTGLGVARVTAVEMPPVLVASLRATGETGTTKLSGLPLPPLPDVPSVAIGPGTAEGGVPEDEVRRAVAVYTAALSGVLKMLPG